MAFDLTAQAFPPKYKFTDIPKMLAWSIANAKSLKLEKSDFETKDDYVIRMKNVSIPGIDADGMALVELPFGGRQVHKEYLAEQTNLRIKVTLTKGTRLGQQIYAILGDKTFSKRQYAGTNAFGVKTLITAEKIESFGVAISKKAGSPLDRQTLTYSLNFEPAEAKEVFPHVSLIIIGKPATPLVKQDAYYSSATINDPFEMSRLFKVIELVNAQIWVINKSTGVVLWKDDYSLN